MARVKARWSGRLLRQMFREGTTVVLLARLDHDPDRVVEIRIPKSSTEAFLKAFMREAALPDEPNGRHHQDDEF